MAFPTTSILTTFTNANQDPLSLGGLFAAAPVFFGGARCKLVSNACTGSTPATQGTSYWATSFNASQEAYFTLTIKWSADGAGPFLLLNITSPNTASTTGCYLFTVYGSSGSIAEIYRIDNNSSFNKLGATVTGLTITNGDKFGASNVGGTLTFYQNTGSGWNTIATRTDSTYGAGYIGLGADNDTISMDDLGGGNFVASATKSLALLGVG